jgi:hypothetical protein
MCLEFDPDDMLLTAFPRIRLVMEQIAEKDMSI